MASPLVSFTAPERNIIRPSSHTSSQRAGSGGVRSGVTRARTTARRGYRGASFPATGRPIENQAEKILANGNQRTNNPPTSRSEGQRPGAMLAMSRSESATPPAQSTGEENGPCALDPTQRVDTRVGLQVPRFCRVALSRSAAGNIPWCRSAPEPASRARRTRTDERARARGKTARGRCDGWRAWSSRPTQPSPNRRAREPVGHGQGLKSGRLPDGFPLAIGRDHIVGRDAAHDAGEQIPGAAQMRMTEIEDDKIGGQPPFQRTPGQAGPSTVRMLPVAMPRMAAGGGGDASPD